MILFNMRVHVKLVFKGHWTKITRKLHMSVGMHLFLMPCHTVLVDKGQVTNITTMYFLTMFGLLVLLQRVFELEPIVTIITLKLVGLFDNLSNSFHSHLLSFGLVFRFAKLWGQTEPRRSSGRNWIIWLDSFATFRFWFKHHLRSGTPKPEQPLQYLSLSNVVFSKDILLKLIKYPKQYLNCSYQLRDSIIDC